jgi:short-subunit dehydrogenase
VVEETVERFGSIFAVFANAGYGVEGAAHTLDLEEHRGIFDVNYFGTLHVVLPAVERMLEAGEGRVIICSSCLSHFPLAHYGAYCATKAAQHHLGRSMNQELRGTGVTATTIHPVGTRTEFFEQASERSRAAALVDRSLEKSMQSPEEAARAVMKALRRPRPEVWLSQPTRLGMIFSMLLRRATDAVVRRLVAHRRRRVEHSSGKNAPG